MSKGSASSKLSKESRAYSSKTIFINPETVEKLRPGIDYPIGGIVYSLLKLIFGEGRKKKSST